MLGGKKTVAQLRIESKLFLGVGVGVLGSAQGLVLARQNWRPITILFSFLSP